MRDSKFSRPITFVVVGDGKIGKSSAAQAYFREIEPDNPDHNIEIFTKIIVLDEERVKLEWRDPGEEEL